MPLHTSYSHDVPDPKLVLLLLLLLCGCYYFLCFDNSGVTLSSLLLSEDAFPSPQTSEPPEGNTMIVLPVFHPLHSFGCVSPGGWYLQ